MYLSWNIVSYFSVITMLEYTNSIIIDVNENTNSRNLSRDNQVIRGKDLLPPKMSEEDENSVLVADHLTCTSCEAVAFQLHRSFTLAHKYKHKALTESELLEITGKL